jgi:uncharacterized repeat protein (TIGR03803 family)
MASVSPGRDRGISPSLFPGLFALLIAMFWPCQAVFAATVTTLHTFCLRNASCSDGFAPGASLVADAAGNLFGTTTSGGAHNFGTAFELRRNGTKYKFERIYSFCVEAACKDGQTPSSKLIVDVNGNLYGTTLQGATGGGGLVFKLVPNPAHSKWTFETLHEFCGRPDCSDAFKRGYEPRSGLTYRGAELGTLYDGASPLFGTTYHGGVSGVEDGTIYQLSAAAGSRKLRKAVLYKFCSQSNCADGANPNSDLVFDSRGNLFGTTPLGGDAGVGVVFELSPQAKGFRETTLYSFCRLPNCTDGATPDGALILNAHNDLIGTTTTGGANDFSASGGTVFKIVPRGVNSTESILYNFCSQIDCADGAAPVGGVVMNANGNLFGMTRSAAQVGATSLFELRGSTETLLASFCPTEDCDLAQGGLTIGPSGHIFGTTGGNGEPQGPSPSSVFEVTP